MKKTEFYSFQNIVLALLGPILLIAIYLSANNALQTYINSEKNRQYSAWSVLQLYKEMKEVCFQSNLYINDISNKKSLQVAYEILWSRIPLTRSSLQEDDIFVASNEAHLEQLLTETFTHIESIEETILSNKVVDKERLQKWTSEVENYGYSISISLLHDLISSSSPYSKALRNQVIKSAGLLLLSTLAVILYLGYLLSALWVQRRKHQHLLDHDSLTGLYSRDYTMRLIQSLCDKETPFTLLSFDINKFKSTNDTLGHSAGDLLLKHLGKVCEQSLSQFGSVGRVGGDEFLCIIEGEELTDINNYYSLFLSLLDTPCSVQGYPVYLKLSTGACLISDCSFNSNVALEKADEAMYRAKRISQRGIFWFGNPSTKTTDARTVDTDTALSLSKDSTKLPGKN